jgi:hypothetical protein
MSLAKDVLYDVDWQKMRVSFLAAYHPQRGWVTEEGTQSNLQTLESYITTIGASNWPVAFRRVWRTLNCVNAVLEGYSGQGKLKTPRALAAKAFQQKVSKLYHHLKETQTFGEWDWNKVKSDLRDLYKNEIIWFERIKRDVGTKRTSTSTSKQKFLELMDEVMKGV